MNGWRPSVGEAPGAVVSGGGPHFSRRYLQELCWVFTRKSHEKSPAGTGRRRESVTIVKHTKGVPHNRDLASREGGLTEPCPRWRDNAVSSLAPVTVILHPGGLREELRQWRNTWGGHTTQRPRPVARLRFSYMAVELFPSAHSASLQRGLGARRGAAAERSVRRRSSKKGGPRVNTLHQSRDLEGAGVSGVC